MNFNIEPNFLIPLIFVLVTQIWKYVDTDSFAKAQRWVTLGLIGFAVAINAVYYLALDAFVGAANEYEVALMVLFVVLEGIIFGASASGIYEAGNNADIPGFKSVNDLRADG